MPDAGNDAGRSTKDFAASRTRYKRADADRSCPGAGACRALHVAMSPLELKMLTPTPNARSKRPRNAVRLTELLGGGATMLAAPVNEAMMPAL